MGYAGIFGEDSDGDGLFGVRCGDLDGDGGDEVEAPDDFAGDEEGVDGDIGADHTGVFHCTGAGCFIISDSLACLRIATALLVAVRWARVIFWMKGWDWYWGSIWKSCRGP